MTKKSDDLVGRMVTRIVETAAPEEVILFGSRASGRAGEESDFDFLVVESAPFGRGRSRRKEMTRLWKALASFPVSKDILVFSREEVEQWRDSPHHVIGQACREGRRLYERP